MENRKRNIQMKFYVTEEEKRLIDEKMKQLPIKQYGAYFRKMAIDGYILVIDRSDTKAYIRELQAVSRNINQIAKRANATGAVYQQDIEDIKKAVDEIWRLQRRTLSFDDISIANATIIDARSSSAINNSVYDREINSISRLTAAVEAVEELNEADEDAGAFVEIDLYVKDGEITFICVQDVNGEGEGETVVEDTDIDEVVLEDNGNVYLYNDDEQVESKVARDWELYRFTTSEGWTRYDYGANYVYGEPNPWTLVDGGEYYVVIDGVKSNSIVADLT